MPRAAPTVATGRRRVTRLVPAVALIALATASPGIGVPRVVEVRPGEDWCRSLATLAPGAELVLLPGDHPGGCSIRNGGSAAAPRVVRSKDRHRPARIVYTGHATNVVNVRASGIVLRDLRFAPTRPGVDAIRIYEGRDIAIERCEFDGLGGIAVAATHASVERVAVRDSTFRRSNATAMYFGCHEGARCAATGLVIERNYIDGVDAADPQIGYGVQLKLNSWGVVRDNVIVDTKGPAIMVYGAADATRASVIERNLVVGSRQSSGVVVGGGPAVVRNNIALGSAEAGIALLDYGQRGLLRGIAVLHNSLYGNRAGGVTVPPAGALDARLVNNLAHAPEGAAALPAPRENLALAGNVDCSRRSCFADPERWDVSPAGAHRVDADAAGPADDYAGAPRGPSPLAGALEAATGALPRGPKRPLRPGS